MVLFSYNRQMRTTPSYLLSAGYLRELLTLLPLESHLRQYIEAELAVAETLSTPDLPVTYPLSGDNSFFTSSELLNLIELLPGDKVSTINVQNLYTNTVLI
jgi:Ser/Thr protein kinase RdoA (MazF antagonist)